MNPRLITVLQLSMVALMAGHVLSTFPSLPEVVASHFNASGAADSFMARETYMALFALLGIAVPLGVGWLPGAIARKGGKGLNIPHRDYWLADARRDQTAAFLQAHGLWLSVLLSALMAFVNAQVVKAHQFQPPVLQTSAVMSALAVFLLLVAVWLGVLIVRFRKAAPK